MNLWIALFSFLLPIAPPSPADQVASFDTDTHAPLRYRGIEQLLAKFDAEAAADSPTPHD